MTNNDLNWQNAPKATKYLYLQIMRDLKDYCGKGYCEIEVTLYRFVTMPNSLTKRLLQSVPLYKRIKHFIVDWANFDSVYHFYVNFIKILCGLNHKPFDEKAFNEALDEQTQYLKYKGSNK